TPPHNSTLFPYTTLFRSYPGTNPYLGKKESINNGMTLYRWRCGECHALDATGYRGPDLTAVIAAGAADEHLFDVIRHGVPGTERSEEHTSELQSQSNLVC